MASLLPCAGTVAYMAPEVLQKGAMAMPADVYSFAMLMLELWTGEIVYSGINSHQVTLCRTPLLLPCGCAAAQRREARQRTVIMGRPAAPSSCAYGTCKWSHPAEAASGQLSAL